MLSRKACLGAALALAAPLFLVGSIHLPTPPQPGLGVCIDVDGQKIPPGCTPAA